MLGIEVLTALAGLIPTIKEISTIIKDLRKAPLDQDAKEAVRKMADEVTRSSEEIVKVTMPFTGLLATDPDFPARFMELYAEFNAGKANNQFNVRTHCGLVTKHLRRLVGYDEVKDRGTSITDKIKNFGDKFKLNKDAVKRLRDLGTQFEGADNLLKEEMESYLDNTSTILTSIRDDISASQSAPDEDTSMDYAHSAKKKFDRYTSTILPNLKELTFLLSDLKITLGSL